MSSIDNKEIMQNLGVGTVIAGVKVEIDYFSGKNQHSGVSEKWSLSEQQTFSDLDALCLDIKSPEISFRR